MMPLASNTSSAPVTPARRTPSSNAMNSCVNPNFVTIHPIVRHEQPARQSFLDVTACVLEGRVPAERRRLQLGRLGGTAINRAATCAADRSDTGNRIRHRLVAPRHDSRQQRSTAGGKLAAVFWQQLPLHYGIGGILIPGIAD